MDLILPAGCLYHGETRFEAKRVIVEMRDGTKTCMQHAKILVKLKHKRTGDLVVLKLTKKGNCYIANDPQAAWEWDYNHTWDQIHETDFQEILDRLTEDRGIHGQIKYRLALRIG
jgi:hypothetical protein